MINSSINDSDNTHKQQSVVKVMVSKQGYADKTEAEAGVASTDMSAGGCVAMEITVQRQSELCEAGYTIIPAIIQGAIRAENFVEQRSFFVDIDNKHTNGAHMSVEEALDVCGQASVMPAFIYYSFSHTPEHPKFRIVFTYERVLTKAEDDLRDSIQRKLISMFHRDGVLVGDTSCRNRNRCFFGATQKEEYLPAVVYRACDTVFTIASAELLVDRIGETPTPVEGTRTAPVLDAQMGNGEFPTTPEVECLKRGDATKLKALIERRLSTGGTPPYILGIFLFLDYVRGSTTQPRDFRNVEDICNFINRLPLHLILGTDTYPKLHRCLLHTHTDRSASANISVLRNGTYRYNCFSSKCLAKDVEDFREGVGISVIDTIQHYTNYGIPETIEFMEELLGMKFQSQMQIQQIMRLQRDKDHITSPAFEREYGDILTYMREANCLDLYLVMLDEAMRRIHDEQVTRDQRPIFFAPVRELGATMRRLGKSPYNKETVHQKIMLLSTIGMIEKEGNATLTKPVLDRAYDLRNRGGNAQNKRSDFYHIPMYSRRRFEYVRQQIRLLKESGYRRSMATRDQLISTMGKEVADKVYVQQAKFGVSEEIDAFYAVYRSVVEEMLDTQGFATEADAIAIAADRTHRGMYISEVWAKGRNSMLTEELDLDWVRVNNTIRNVYTLPESVTTNQRIFVRPVHGEE